MSGTVTHDLAQYLNQQIRPFINKTHMIGCSDELLVHLKSLTLTGTEKMASLDVESFFTNVPTEEIIEIIINTVYNHPTLPPPPLKTDTMRKLLQVCTSETPFHFCGKTYVKIDGVSMGSPLRPTFADFYMSYLENTLLQQQHRVSNPIF